MTRLLAAVAACALALAGCQTTTLSTVGSLAGQASTLVPQAQAYVVSTCGYLPTAETVTRIAATLAGQTATEALAETVANAICQAVAPATAYTAGSAKAPLPPRRPKTVNGVVIHGKFVNH